MLVVPLLVACVAIAAPAVRAETPPAGRSDPDPTALWNAFPLRASPADVFTPPRARPPFSKLPAAIPPAIVRSEDPSTSWWAVVAGLGALLIVASGAAILVLRGPAARWSRATAAALASGRTGAARRESHVPPRPTAEQSYLLLVHGRIRSRVVERMGVPPFRGELIFDDELGRPGQVYVVEAVGPSPLPNDRRACARLRTLSR